MSVGESRYRGGGGVGLRDLILIKQRDDALARGRDRAFSTNVQPSGRRPEAFQKIAEAGVIASLEEWSEEILTNAMAAVACFLSLQVVEWLA